MALLDGVRIGPLDPDRGEHFGQVGGQTTARRLLRHHAAMHPPAVLRALNRVQHLERSRAIEKGEAEAVVRKTLAENGQALPDEATFEGFAVHGDDDAPDEQALVAVYRLPSGRTGKAVVAYNGDGLDETRSLGDDAVRIKALKEAGLPWEPSERTRKAWGISEGGDGAVDSAVRSGGAGEKPAADDDAEKSELRSEIAALKERLAAVEGATGSSDSGVTSSPQTAEGGDPATAGDRQQPAEPWGGYAGAKAQDVVHRLREEKDPELARRVLAFEESPAGQGRGTVTSAANQIIDRTP